MDKNILADYIDCCELLKETEKDIRRLRKKKKTIIQTNVSGSNPEFPYNPQHFKIQGTTFTYREDSQLRMEEQLLEKRKQDCEAMKLEVEAWLNTVPKRMQRIIRYKFFDRMSWEEVAVQMKCSAGSIKMEFQRFMEKN